MLFKPGTRNRKHTSAVGLCGVTWGQARSALQHCCVYTPALYSQIPASNLGVVTGTQSDIPSTAGQIPAGRPLYTPLRCHLPSSYNWWPGSTCPWQSEATLCYVRTLGILTHQMVALLQVQLYEIYRPHLNRHIDHASTVSRSSETGF